MVSLLLDLCYAIAAVVTAPWWLRKARGGWRERFGRTAPLLEKQRPRILLHAVSVGEVNLIRALVASLAEPCEVVVSATTDTGIARARQLYGEMGPGVRVVRYPLDASWSVRRFLDAVRPDVVALVELELWPNFFRACGRRGIAVAVVNGRLSDRSFKRYFALRLLFARWFGRLAFVAAQDETYAERFRRVGVAPERCRVVGSMKWDAVEISDRVPGSEELAKAMGIDRSRPLIVAGSTAPDEHALLHAATPPGVQLLCAPRRPEWFDDAARDLPGCVRRSKGEAKDGSSAGRFLLDSIGELRQAYALADVVVIGRSFGALFGSDPMEPAALGKAIVIGPSVADFRASVDTMLAAGAIESSSRERLWETLATLINDHVRRAALGEKARRCSLANRGATERTVRLLLSLAGASARGGERPDFDHLGIFSNGTGTGEISERRRLAGRERSQ